MILSKGTKVVLKVNLFTIGKKILKAKGASGKIIQSPSDPLHQYRIVFSDGTEVMAKGEQIIILKHFQGIDYNAEGALLEEYDLYQHVVLQCVVGSRAYGLEHENSDVDRRGIYQAPAHIHWSLYGVPEQIENKITDECYWELQKFITLALKANPNVLEVLYTPLVEHVSGVGEMILEQRELFLSQLVYQTFSRYVMSQFKKLSNRIERGDEIRWKHAMHLIRLLLSGKTILKEGFVPVRVEKYRDKLCEIRDGHMPWEAVDVWRLELHRQFDDAFAKTKLPERPDYVAINTLLIEARRSVV